MELGHPKRWIVKYGWIKGLRKSQNSLAPFFSAQLDTAYILFEDRFFPCAKVATGSINFNCSYSLVCQRNPFIFLSISFHYGKEQLIDPSFMDPFHGSITVDRRLGNQD